MATATVQRKWLRLSEVAAETGFPIKALLSAIHRGQLHAVQIGQGRNSPFRVSREHLDAWLQSKRAGRRAY